MNDQRGALEEERDFLLASIRDLDAEHAAGDLDDADYVRLRDGYTARAAAVLRVLDGEVVAPGARRARPDNRRFRMTALVVAGVVALAVAAGAFVASSSGERLPGQSTTGSVPASGNDRLAQARSLLGQGKAVEAIKTYDGILKDDPRNTEALTYRGWVLKLAGLPDQALASLDQAIAVDPNYPDAHVFRGLVLQQDKHDPAGAVEEFRAYLSRSPDPQMAPVVEDALKKAQQDAGQPSS